MFGDTMVGSARKTKTNSYLARPKLGILKSLYSGRVFSNSTPEKRRKSKKPSNTFSKMDYIPKKKPDYIVDNAYREAVSRLRILLAESYTPARRDFIQDSAGEETDNQSMISAESKYSRPRHRFYPRYYPSLVSKKYYFPQYTPKINTSLEKNIDEPPKYESTIPPELMSFIERQEDYIEQLEKESRFCKTELSSLLNKVKDVISENENLHERQKNKLIKSVFDELEVETEDTETDGDVKKLIKSKKKHFEGPSIVFESRISELEAQLTQAKIDLKKSQEEKDELKKKFSDGTIPSDGFGETLKKQIGNLQRDKMILQETVTKLENALAQLKTREFDTTDAVKRSLDAAEHAQYEKNAAEHEIRRLKEELERQHVKLRDAITDQSRRIADERNAVERRFSQQIEQLNTELGLQWETTNKLQLELDKNRRENADLRRENAQKQALIDELKKDMQNKIVTLQSDIGVSGAEKSALEQQISTLQLSNERTERHYKQEIIRLQAELQSLRQRSDRADSDLIHSRRENLRLMEQVASLEKEIKLNAALSEESGKKLEALPPSVSKKDDHELGSLIHDLESKHEATVAELETMIRTQNQLMDKLSDECRNLTVKLEESNTRHKEEIWELQNNLASLRDQLNQTPKYEDEGSRSNITQPISNEVEKNVEISRETDGKPEEELVQKQYDPNQYEEQNYEMNQDYDPNQQYDNQGQYDHQNYDQNYYDQNATYQEENQSYLPTDTDQYVESK